MRNNFTEGQALSSVSARREGVQSPEQLRAEKRQSIKRNHGKFDSRVQRGDETKAHSFSGPVVLVFEASQHSVPHILQNTHQPTRALYCCCSCHDLLQEHVQPADDLCL